MAKSRSRVGNPLVAVAYIRVSKDEQRLGPEAQRAAIESWARTHGATVAAWHVDQGVCSVTPIEDRPALVAALADLSASGAGVLVVAKRDRISRDPMLTAQITGTAAGLGAQVQSAAGEGNGTSPADEFMRLVIDGAAQYERSLIRARTKAALAAKRARRECSGTVPYGMRLAADGQHNKILSGERRGERRCAGDCAGCVRLEPHPGEQATIARVAELRRAGLSVRAVAAELATAGVVGRTGKPLSHTQVHRLAPRDEAHEAAA